MLRSTGATVGALAVLGLLVAAAPTGATSPPTAQAPTGTLYVQQAESAALKRVGDGWRLVLRGPAPRVTTFADRPQRTGGSQTLSAFTAGWTRAFGDVPPNAALELVDAPIGRDLALLELGAPRYDRRRDTVTYPAKALTESSSRALQGFAARVDRGLKGELGRATLFIDDGASAGQVLSVSVTGLPTGSHLAVDLEGARLDATQPASMTVLGPSSWELDTFGLIFRCDAETSCNGTISAVLDAPAGQPVGANLHMGGGDVTLSWAGGPPQTVSGGNSGLVLLEPGA